MYVVCVQSNMWFTEASSVDYSSKQTLLFSYGQTIQYQTFTFART